MQANVEVSDKLQFVVSPLRSSGLSIETRCSVKSGNSVGVTSAIEGGADELTSKEVTSCCSPFLSTGRSYGVAMDLVVRRVNNDFMAGDRLLKLESAVKAFVRVFH